jgi:hypothetical protein
MRDKNAYHFNGENSRKCATWMALKGMEWMVMKGGSKWPSSWVLFFFFTIALFRPVSPLSSSMRGPQIPVVTSFKSFSLMTLKETARGQSQKTWRRVLVSNSYLWIFYDAWQSLIRTSIGAVLQRELFTSGQSLSCTIIMTDKHKFLISKWNCLPQVLQTGESYNDSILTQIQIMTVMEWQ